MLAMQNESGQQHYGEQFISFDMYLKSPEYKAQM
jgi:hypothetical protein